MKKLLAAGLFFAGACIFVYPEASEFAADRQQDRLVKQWEAQDAAEAEEVSTETEESYAQLDRVFAVGGSESVSEDVTSENQDVQTEGVIRIPAIDVELPILPGATEEHLDIGAGLIEGTAALGKAGNSAIAAHRSYTYGRMFNRLDELAAGDEVEIETREGTFVYHVFDTVVVPPFDTSVLDQSTGDESLVTLVTCTPMKNPTHRLIVQAKAISN
ncbi:sortase A [Alteribacillus persepolensis]|uniref:Sortase A n=1 Tax=Alteribacillus persepolensis TaxID=568899 RepID=A0A1G8JQS3_9BACI|nr:class D sortase [Alteribacillus persepolensis]SDI33639.1 sortase A [Alteribacillus persepolensis]